MSRLGRTDLVTGTWYTLTFCGLVDVRLTDRQARDLYQLLHEEFKPKYQLGISEIVSPSPGGSES
ncbi:Uncharacterised protein [Mycobacteroides abscessus subsp. massiliense]|nr:Uncharacterised protein [Mycobacteroides abscessus subsp. massiliense]SKU76625.1 Uncharacterised protein [Mycobacteroides abscessus subsp. massiliense]